MRVSGLLLYDKPAGPTSYRALGAFKSAFPGCRVGHAGTLDSFATGLLLLMAGSYSRLAPWFVGLDKSYLARVDFGSETDTLDPSGEVVAEGPRPTRQALEAALPRFTGPIMQIPPKYSAIHVQGARASDLAVKGRDFELAPRQVTIHSLDLLSYEDGSAVLSVRCSSGTYIRSLARDIALSLGSFAHLGSLRRLSVGPFSVDDAEKTISADTPLRTLDPETARSIGLSVGLLQEGWTEDFRNGKASALTRLGSLGSGADCAVFSNRGELLGVAGRKGSGFSYRLVLSEAGGAP